MKRLVPLSDQAIVHTSAEKLLSAVFYVAYQYQFPIAVWKLPESKHIRLVIDFSSSLLPVKADLEELVSGFLISPFINRGAEAWFIQADLFWQGSWESNTAENFSFSHRAEQYFSEEFQKKNLFIQSLENLLAHPTAFSKLSLKPIHQSFYMSELDFESAVAEAVKAIQQGQFRKVVLSRSKEVSLPTDFDLIATFKKICNAYPHALVSLVSTPQTGTWIGATPETLVSVDKYKIFRTVALAGTQAKGSLTNLSEALWTQKEIEEQALVSRYIINCLKKIRVREFEEVGPKTVASGNLLHLRTDFEINMNEINFPQLGSVMLELLHPTSAVCGMPKEAALQFILEKEKYDRELYSGYLGQVNIEEESAIFVNLRCMQVFDKKAILYAGAGITQDSHAEKEWKETEMKMETMLRMLY